MASSPSSQASIAAIYKARTEELTFPRWKAGRSTRSGGSDGSYSPWTVRQVKDEATLRCGGNQMPVTLYSIESEEVDVR